MYKIAIAHSLYTPDIVGGAEVSTQLLAETLSSTFSVSVITVGSQEEKIVIREIINGVEVIRLHHSNLYWFGDVSIKKSFFQKIIWRLLDCFNYKQYKTVKKILIEMEPDILHTQNLSGLSMSIWYAAIKLNIPIVHTLRDYTLINPVPNKLFSYAYQQVIKVISKKVKGVIGISNNILQKHLSTGYFESAQSFIVLNAIKQDPEMERLYFNKNISSDALVLGYFGQLVTLKGIDLLIQAVKKIPSSVIKKLYICGEGVDGNRLKELAAEDERIIFLGRLDRRGTSEVMSKVDLTIVPSVWDEPFGRVIIESYQVGTVVLASNIGGIPEIIFDKTNHLFKANSIEAIVEAVMQYYSLTAEQKMFLTRSCYEYSHQFSTEVLLRKHKSIYELLFKPKC